MKRVLSLVRNLAGDKRTSPNSLEIFKELMVKILPSKNCAKISARIHQDR